MGSSIGWQEREYEQFNSLKIYKIKRLSVRDTKSSSDSEQCYDTYRPIHTVCRYIYTHLTFYCQISNIFVDIIM